MTAPLNHLEAAKQRTLGDEMLSDLGGYLKRLSTDTCPDLVARIRADIADTVKKRGPVHEDRQCEVNECFAFPLICFATQLGGWEAFSPRRWEWIAASFAEYFDCDPEDVDLTETDDGNLITVKGKIVGFVRTRSA
jgi:hypothetical protein